MSAWLYRWENGDCSIVWATTRIAAIEILDEVGEAQSRYLIPLPAGAWHFALTDSGELDSEGHSESMLEPIDRAYPHIAKIQNSTQARQKEEFAALMEAVETERTRVQYEATKAETPAGQVIADRMNVNPELADKWAREDEAAAAMAREDEAAQ